jgi:hypothetical protein
MQIRFFVTYPKLLQIWIICSIILAFTSLLTGCGKSGGPAGLNQNNAGNSGIPAELKEEKELYDVSLLEGATRTNPFLSLLIPERTAAELAEQNRAEEAEVTPPPADPYAGYSVGGIIYRGKNSQAIIRLGEGKSKIVRLGDIYYIPSDPPMQIKVTSIDKETITFKTLNAPADYPANYKVRTFKLPSLVGYGKIEAEPTPQANPSPAKQAPTQDTFAADKTKELGADDFPELSDAQKALLSKDEKLQKVLNDLKKLNN